MSNVPADLLYTKSHEWVRLDGDTATIGITDHAQSELGDIVYVDLPAVGRAIGVGDSFGSIESVKTVSDVYAPAAGTITEVNGAIGSQSELLNTDPYGAGWLVKVKLDNAGELDALMSGDAYAAMIA